MVSEECEQLCPHLELPLGQPASWIVLYAALVILTETIVVGIMEFWKFVEKLDVCFEEFVRVLWF